MSGRAWFTYPTDARPNLSFIGVRTYCVRHPEVLISESTPAHVWQGPCEKCVGAYRRAALAPKP